jgi:hypothetical protein
VLPTLFKTFWPDYHKNLSLHLNFRSGCGCFPESEPDLDPLDPVKNPLDPHQIVRSSEQIWSSIFSLLQCQAGHGNTELEFVKLNPIAVLSVLQNRYSQSCIAIGF